MTNSFDTMISDAKISPYITKTKSPVSKTSDTTGLVRPLPANGYLVKQTIWETPSVMVADFAKDIKNVGKGLKGDLNDHELGRLNDVGMKLGGLAIASYLAIRKTSPTQKIMEFLGFGTFFGSMYLWPKLMIEKPIEWMHGVNVHQKYVDNQGRKKMFFQDPQFVPWDLWKHEEIEKLGDKMQIPQNIPNRQIMIKESAQKTAIQANTLWMWTAGLATPLMTAMICSAIQKPIEQAATTHNTKKALSGLKNVEQNIGKNLNKEKEKAFLVFLENLQDAEINNSLISDIAREMINGPAIIGTKAVEEDIKNLIDTTKSTEMVSPEDFFDRLFKAKYRTTPIAQVTETLNDKIKKTNPNGKEMLKAVKKDFVKLLTEEINTQDPEAIKQATELIKKDPRIQSLNIDRNIRLATVALEYGSSTRTLNAEMIEKLKKAYSAFSYLDAGNRLISHHYNVFVGQNAGSAIAVEWNSTMGQFIKLLNFSQNEMKQLEKNTPILTTPKALEKLLSDKIQRISLDEKRYKKFMASYAKRLEHFEKTLNENIVIEAFKNYDEILERASERFNDVGFTRTAEFLTGNPADKFMHNFRMGFLRALGLSKSTVEKELLINAETPKALILKRITEIKKDQRLTNQMQATLRELLGDAILPPLSQAIKEERMTRSGKPLDEATIDNIPWDEVINKLKKGTLPQNNTGIKRFTEILESFGTYSEETLKEQLKFSNEFKKDLPMFIDAIFEDDTLRDNLLFRKNFHKEIPECLSNSAVPKTAQDQYSKLVKVIRELFLKSPVPNNIFAGDPGYLNWITNSVLSTSDDLADTHANNLKHILSEQLLGARSCLYRLIQTMDFERRVSSGNFMEQCQKMLEKTNIPQEKYSEKINYYKEICRDILMNGDIEAHCRKFSLKTPDYKNIVRLLFEAEPDPITTQALDSIDPQLADNFRKYLSAIVSQSINATDPFHPKSTLSSFPLEKSGNPLRKHLLVAKDFLSAVTQPAVSRNNGNRWFKLFGGTFGALVGVTLLADAFLCKPNVKQPNPINKIRHAQKQSLKA